LAAGEAGGEDEVRAAAAAAASSRRSAAVTYGEDYGTILSLAVPAFFALMLDPLMAAVDAGDLQ
jgi:hypothetical protein